ncbi:MAG: hypothetical protein IPL78_21915 [Chloroflexi bacterium]|nr:hypothetical protein [Chloroflexota bacterium]
MERLREEVGEMRPRVGLLAGEERTRCDSECWVYLWTVPNFPRYGKSSITFVTGLW